MAGLRLAWNVGADNANDAQAITAYSQVSGYAQVTLRAATRFGTTPMFFVDFTTSQLGTTPSLIYYAAYRNASPFDLMESGEFYFDGTQIIKTPELYPFIDALKTEHDNTQALINALNDVSTAEVNSQVDLALADYDAPTKAEMDSAIGGLNNLSASEVNAEVDSALADYDAPTKAEMDSAIGALNNLSAADVKAQVDLSLTDYDPPTNAELSAVQTAVLSSINSGNTATVNAIGALNDVSTAEVNAQVDLALSDYDGPTRAELTSDKNEIITSTETERATVVTAITNAQTAINSNTDTMVGALNDVSVAEIEAGLINDADGTAFKDALATTIETYLLNDTDGQAVLAGIGGVLSAQLTNYGVATATDVTASESDVITAINALDFATPNNVTDARDLIRGDIAGIPTVDVSSLATGAQISSLQTTLQNNISSLNDLSAADVANALFSYGTATVATVNTARTVVTDAVAGLNNLSVAELTTELSNLNVANATDVSNIRADISASSANTATEATLVAVQQLLRADQVPVGNDIVYYREGSNKTVELHRQTITGGVSVLSGLGLES